MRDVLSILIVLNCIVSLAIASSPSASSQNAKTQKLFVLPDGYKKYTLSFGNPNAPIKIHKFFSFSCVSCLMFHKNHFPLILNEFINEGKVYWTLVPYVMDVDTLYVMAATTSCSEKIKRRVFDCILEKALVWTDDDNKESVVKTLSECGVTEEEIQSHLSEANYENVLRESFDFQEYITIDGTPTLFINGIEVPGVPSGKKLSEMIDNMLKSESMEEQ